MNGLIRIGRLVFAVAMMCFGFLYLVYASGIGRPVPGPPWSAGSHAVAWLVGVGFIAIGICIVLRLQGQAAATLLGVVFLLRAFIVYLFSLPTHLHDPFRWTSGFELVALGGAALVLAGTFPVDARSPVGLRGGLDKFFEVGRYLFAIGLVIFGVQHLMYARFITTDIPVWIPWKLFWAYFVGVAFFAAALSIATGKMVSLAATLLGAMFLLWVIILHMPRVVAAPGNGNEWTSEFVALAMGGASFLMASAFGRNRANAVR
jgi:uncharacterized membrane protein YphA (DoxX/SURF4 family)